MTTPSRIIVTSAKAALLASSLLGMAFIFLQNEAIGSIPVIFMLSMIVTFIISSIMVFVTIVPFHELSPNLSLEEKFKRYFPFYSIVFFLVCFYIIYGQNFDELAAVIFGIAYITAMQSWVWFFNHNKLKK